MKPVKKSKPATKMGQPYIPSYQKGGMVTKPTGVYTAEMGPPPPNVDSLSALPPKQQREGQRRADAQLRKDYPPKKAK